MSVQMSTTRPFRSILTGQVLKAILYAFVISLPLILLPAYFVIQNQISSNIEKIETTSYQIIGEHLSKGWSPKNLKKFYQALQEEVPSATLFLNKEISLITQQEPVKTVPKAQFKPIIEYVRKHEETIIDSNLLQGTITAGFPIRFQKTCLNCHMKHLQMGKILADGLAATMVVQLPMSVNHIPTDSILTFLFIYTLIFVLLVSLFTLLLIEKRLLLPILELNNRIRRLQLSAHDREVDWQRTPQEVLEIDEMDLNLTDHIDSLQQLYHKLDKLIINEPHTGILNEAQYHFTLRKELKRSIRYQHPFSVLLIKIISIKVLNPTAKNLEQQDPEIKFHIFGDVLLRGSRETDSIFRLEETVYALIAPETGVEGAKVLKRDIFHRLIGSPLPEDSYGTSMAPEYQFTMQVGIATSDEDEDSEINLTKSAMLSLKNSAKVTGRYPMQSR